MLRRTLELDGIGVRVDYKGLHGTNERIRIDSIPLVQAAYHQACLTLLIPS